MTIAQDIRNAYDARDREALELAIRRLDALISEAIYADPSEHINGPDWHRRAGKATEEVYAPDMGSHMISGRVKFDADGFGIATIDSTTRPKGTP